MVDVFVKRLHILGGAEAFLTPCINLGKISLYKKFRGKRLALINSGTVCSFFFLSSFEHDLLRFLCSTFA